MTVPNPASTADASSSLPTLHHLATLKPPPSAAGSRAWHTSPHPTLPILATASSDKTVRIYSLTSYTLLSTISGGHKRSVRASAWKPNLKGESLLATASFDASVGIWRRWEDEDGLGLSRGREYVGEDLTGGNVGEENLDEEDDNEEWRFAVVLDGHDSEVKSVGWSAGGNLLATCSRDKSVWIWEETAEEEFETIAVLQEHEGDVKCVAWHSEEELLASGSYDDEIRLWRDEGDDWGCVWVGKGHTGTVWSVGWEGLQPRVYATKSEKHAIADQELWRERRERSGARLLSCSDDATVRVWRRNPKQRVQQSPFSIIKSGDSGEDWIQEAILPRVHERGIYTTAWSHQSGRIVSTGGDGLIVIYQEEWSKPVQTSSNGADTNGQLHMDAKSDEMVTDESSSEAGKSITETTWRVVARVDAAHGVFEVNHVTWARKPKPRSREEHTIVPLEDEELIITTGDDGTVKVWALAIPENPKPT